MGNAGAIRRIKHRQSIASFEMASHGLFLKFPNEAMAPPWYLTILPILNSRCGHMEAGTTNKKWNKKGGGDGIRKLPLEIGSGSRITRISGPSLKLSGCRRVDERERFQWRPESAEPGIDGPEPCDRSLDVREVGWEKGSSGRRGDKDSEAPGLSRSHTHTHHFNCIGTYGCGESTSPLLALCVL